MNLRRSLTVLLFAALPTVPAGAQTTGFPFVNDLTVNGLLSGSTSCNLVNLAAQPSTYQITAAPNSAILLLVDFCGCQGGAIPLGIATCPFPQIQSIDLWMNAGCVSFTIPGVTNGAGVYTLNVPAQTASMRFGIQGAVLSTNCGNILFTQAYDVIL